MYETIGELLWGEKNDILGAENKTRQDEELLFLYGVEEVGDLEE